MHQEEVAQLNRGYDTPAQAEERERLGMVI